MPDRMTLENSLHLFDWDSLSLGEALEDEDEHDEHKEREEYEKSEPKSTHHLHEDFGNEEGEEHVDQDIDSLTG